MERDRLIRWIALVKLARAYFYSSFIVKSSGARKFPIAA
jgi:hypothetical protein